MLQYTFNTICLMTVTHYTAVTLQTTTRCNINVFVVLFTNARNNLQYDWNGYATDNSFHYLKRHRPNVFNLITVFIQFNPTIIIFIYFFQTTRARHKQWDIVVLHLRTKSGVEFNYIFSMLIFNFDKHFIRSFSKV